MIVADRTRSSRKKDSRNALGKSTLIEVIHFCLGSDFAKCKSLRSPDLLDWSFTLEIDLGGKRVEVTRNTSNPRRLLIAGDISTWPVQPSEESDDGTLSYDWKDWNTLLGKLMFNLTATQSRERYAPSFRSLVSYFIRRDKPAFINPFEHHQKQQPWDFQVNIAFLLDLSWEIARDFQVLRDKEKTIKSLKQATALGMLDNLVGAVGKLETQRVQFQNRIDALSKGLESFRVIEQYRYLEERADQVTKEIHDLENESLRNQRVLERYLQSLADEMPPDIHDIENVYRRVGLELPGFALKRIEEVTEFHKKVVSNRRRFLTAEVSRLRDTLAKVRELIDSKISSRAEMMSILASGGALDEYTKLQKDFSKTLSELKNITNKIESLKAIERSQSELKINRESLRQQARLEYDERQILRDKAVGLFASNTESLYSAPGRLIINVGKNGWTFDIELEGSGSHGIENMKILCFDLMLSQLWSQKTPSPGFLVHDSIVFEGVDERQIALAIEMAEREAVSHDFQYICTINSDALPMAEFSEAFSIEDYVRLRLTDDRPEGSLMGIRFRLPEEAYESDEGVSQEE